MVSVYGHLAKTKGKGNALMGVRCKSKVLFSVQVPLTGLAKMNIVAGTQLKITNNPEQPSEKKRKQTNKKQQSNKTFHSRMF